MYEIKLFVFVLKSYCTYFFFHLGKGNNGGCAKESSKKYSHFRRSEVRRCREYIISILNTVFILLITFGVTAYVKFSLIFILPSASEKPMSENWNMFKLNVIF